jgi:primosomal protein N' (replication factor Y)
VIRTARQPSLFHAAPEPATPVAAMVAHVIFNRHVDTPFTYVVPPHLEPLIAVGKRVSAPLGRGNRPAVGYCIGVVRQVPDRQLKEIGAVLDEAPLLTPALLELTHWMAGYYLCPWGQVLDAIVPAGAKEKAGTRERAFLQPVPSENLPYPTPHLTPKQSAALALLQQQPGPVELRKLAELAECTTGVLQGLVKKGYAKRIVQRVEQAPPEIAQPAGEPALILNDDQALAMAAIERAVQDGGFQPFLLHGVTASGKTEIYLRAIEQTVRQGKEALVLVPEISLTPQTIQRFRGRFPHVAVLHSHLGDAERGAHWRRIAAGQVQVVVGARSAVFAPTRRLGIIIVDEEHEGSFKQETTPRYQARDVAVKRASLEKIPIILGSATPSLESWYNVQRRQYKLLSLPVRVLDRPLPEVKLIDLRHEPPTRGRYRAISPTLQHAMQGALATDGQIILLLNRRGFSTHIWCPSCGHVVKCRFCDVAMTHHREHDAAVCHYCGYEQPPPERCPECALSQIRYLGHGTEKLEAEVAQKFPNVSAVRVDSDTMRRPGSHRKVFEAFHKGEIKIMLGTQMIAKGLDFPNVTLVGVVNADLALHVPDFRSAERTFQLLAQVAGRTGRGPRGGCVYVQTFNPEHPCIALAAKHDFVAFVEEELKQRKEHLYPPFSRMARVVLRSKDQALADGFAQQLAERFRQNLTGAAGTANIRLLGPAEAPLFRLQNRYRYHFQLQSSSSAALHDLLARTLKDLKPPKGVDVTVDIDPWSVL